VTTVADPKRRRGRLVAVVAVAVTCVVGPVVTVIDHRDAKAHRARLEARQRHAAATTPSSSSPARHRKVA
jgi:hypothetical protein